MIVHFLGSWRILCIVQRDKQIEHLQENLRSQEVVITTLQRQNAELRASQDQVCGSQSVLKAIANLTLCCLLQAGTKRRRSKSM